MFPGSEPEQIQDFYGVYLLVSNSDEKKYSGKTYIGYTVDPNRRIKQHNAKVKGGAKKTANRGPWSMILIIHGFPNNISALRFEWAWQQPKTSRRLKSIKSLEKKKAKESHISHKFRILTEMLNTGPWNRLNLTIRWLSDDHFIEFPPNKQPPQHMEICFGPVKRSSAMKQSGSDENESFDCEICMEKIENDRYLRCINGNCLFRSHLICLSRVFLESENRGKEQNFIIPIEGDCPRCKKRVLWGDLIRKMNGFLELEDCSEMEHEDSIELELSSENESNVSCCDE